MRRWDQPARPASALGVGPPPNARNVDVDPTRDDGGAPALRDDAVRWFHDANIAPPGRSAIRNGAAIASHDAMRVWHLLAMNPKAWIKAEMHRLNVSQAELARRLGPDFDKTKLSKTLTGPRQLSADEFIEWSRAIGASPPEQMMPKERPETESRPVPAPAAARADIPELDARAGAGHAEPGAHDVGWEGAYDISAPAVLAVWALPADYLRFELRVPRGAVRLVEVIGDSMAPTLLPGDRIMVNTEDKRPSPPGVFALWDGLGVVVKRVEHIPNTDPLVYRISSDNPHHATYERTEEEVTIIGRIVWYGRRM